MLACSSIRMAMLMLQAALVALMADYAAHLVSVAASKDIAELLAMPPTVGRGANHHTVHAQARFC